MVSIYIIDDSREAYRKAEAVLRESGLCPIQTVSELKSRRTTSGLGLGISFTFDCW
jgi:hypothetical protein